MTHQDALELIKAVNTGFASVCFMFLCGIILIIFCK